jgi:hypothetical protein
MAKQSTEPKTHMALDTDWMTAVFVAFCFVLCLLTIAATTRHVLIGAPVKVQVTWDTVFLLLASGWLALGSRERVTKFLCGLFSIVFGSRLLLAVVHASAQIRVLNGEIMRVVELGAMVSLCFYCAHWFRQRIRRV